MKYIGKIRIEMIGLCIRKRIEAVMRGIKDEQEQKKEKKKNRDKKQ